MPGLRSLAVLTIGSAALLPVLASVPADASSGPGSGSSLLKATITAVTHERSVHVVATTKGRTANHAALTVTIVTDAGASVGIQHITYAEATLTGHEIVEEVKGVGYLQADVFTLRDFNGFPASTATKYSMKWISVSKSDSAFSALTSGVLMSSMPTQVEMPNPKLIPGTQQVAGVTVRALRATVTQGSTTLTGTLYVRASGAPLPVEQRFTETTGSASVVNFGTWNEPVHVNAPPSSVPLSTVER